MKFICDAMLGKLSKYLRLIGLDTLYGRSTTEVEQHRQTHPHALFFTRNTRYRNEEGCRFIQSDRPLEQLMEIRDVLRPLVYEAELMSRCPECNASLATVDRREIEPLVPEFVYHQHEIFRQCPLCCKVFWQGSHVEHMKRYLKEVLRS